MNDLSTLLNDIAGDAKYYDPTDRAITVARRQRRLVRLAPVGAVVVALAVLAAAVLLRSNPAGPTIDHSRFAGPTGSLSWLPTHLTSRAGQPALPTDRGVGVASVIYTLPETSTASPAPAGSIRPPVLVTTDGTEYALPAPDQESLSPDGRWLLLFGGGHAVLRDLTSTTQVDLGIDAHGGAITTAWAGDVSRLVLQSTADIQSATNAATVVDLPSTQHHTVGLGRFRSRILCGVQDTGDLVLCPDHLAQSTLTTLIVDNRSGRQLRAVTVDLTSTLTASERTALNTAGLAPLTLLADGHELAFETTTYDAADRIVLPGDLLVLSMDTGTVVRRLTLPRIPPPITVPQSGGVGFIYPDLLDVIATTTDGILLAHSTESVAVRNGVVADLQLLDPTTGRRTVVMTLSGNIEVVHLRGGNA